MKCTFLIHFGVNIFYQCLKEVGSVEVPRELVVYNKCDGKPTAFHQFAVDHLDDLSPCIPKMATDDKYCVHQCMMRQLGYINEDGHLDKNGTKKIMTAYNFYNEHTEEMNKAMEECSEGLNFGSSAKKCKANRDYYYCMYNKTIKICKMREEERKDVNKASQEAGVVQRTVDIANLAI